MNNNKGSMVVLTVIGIATLLIAVIGATFAFFTVTIKNDDEPKDVIVESNTMVIEYMAGNSIKYEGAIPGRPEEAAKNKMTFSVSSNIDMMTVTEYDVYLKITKNEFTENVDGYTNLMYYLDEVEAGKSNPLSDSQVDGVDSVPGTIYGKLEEYEFKGIEQEESNKIKGTKNVGILPYNTDPSNCSSEDGSVMLSEDETACMVKISDGAILGNQGATDKWYFEVWLKETGVNQNYDQGKFLEASIEIVPKNLNKVTNEPDKINP